MVGWEDAINQTYIQDQSRVEQVSHYKEICQATVYCRYL